MSSIIFGILGPITVAPIQINERNAFNKFAVNNNFAASIGDKTNGRSRGNPWVKRYPALHEIFALDTFWEISCFVFSFELIK